MKNIIVCSDGTGNSAIKGRGTNVFKLFEAIDLNGHRHDMAKNPQVALYDDGVGTERFKVLKIFAGATGWGLSRNVMQLYKEIVRIYDPGDKLFLFGFSRGAFTVRTLAGLIHTCGILKAERYTTADKLEAAVRKAYDIYRKRYRTKLLEVFLGKPDDSAIERLREENGRTERVYISFLGVWDTVDAVGLPLGISDFINLTLYRFKFPDSMLNECVERACHALAIDDERHSFHPLLWGNETGKDDPRIEQVWFSGAHSNVGGGYPKQGMSLVALDWMMSEAEKKGLRLLDSDRELFRNRASVDDKLYNSRSGFGMLYRWKPRDITAMCEKCNVTPKVHLSVLERIAHGTDDYTPGNLPPNAGVVFTCTGDAVKNAKVALRASEAEKVFQEAHRDGEPLLARTRGAVFMGMASYYLFLGTLVATLLAAAAPASGPFAENLGSAGRLLASLVTGRWSAVAPSLRQLFDSPWLLGLLAGYLLSWTLAMMADRTMSNTFSEFWFKQQPNLRKALQRARAMAQAAPALPAPSGTLPVVPLTVLGGQGGSQGDGLPIVHLPDGDGRGVQPGSAGPSPKA